ncbi:MAG: hypothetical protein Q8O00_07595, partial [Holophaga sp.]|nr:hypothetical protein [Holophaga sp.]
SDLLQMLHLSEARVAPCFVNFATTSRRQITPPFTATRFLRIHAAGNKSALADVKRAIPEAQLVKVTPDLHYPANT